MSKKDKSLDNIDIVKLLIFVLIFISVALIMIFGFIVPNIKDYSTLSKSEKLQKMSYYKVKNIYDDKSKKLFTTKEKNKFVLNSYENKFNKDKFIKFASSYFNDVKLSQLKHLDTNKTYLLYELSVASSLNTPQKFYDFLDNLSRYENIIKADFPIKMKGSDKIINATFNIKVYGKK